jgi:uncharacterized protein YjbI with pentapeptide repeats
MTLSVSAREGLMQEKLNIKNTNLTGSEFETVNMSGSSFTDINLSKARFVNINFSDGYFAAAQIGGTLFKHIGPPPDKDGKQARQRPVTFEEAMLCDSVFRKTDMSNVQLIDCNIEGMKIDGILVTDMLSAYKKRS